MVTLPFMVGLSLVMAGAAVLWSILTFYEMGLRQMTLAAVSAFLMMSIFATGFILMAVGLN